MTSKPQRILHDHGDLQIVTVKPPDDDRWEIVFAHVSGMAFGDTSIPELNTPERFASDEEAITFASQRLGIRLRPTDKYRLRDTGFRGFCKLVPVGAR